MILRHSVSPISHFVVIEGPCVMSKINIEPKRFSPLRQQGPRSMPFRKKSHCWLIKTTEGGPAYNDHWDEFQAEKVIAIGFLSIKSDPMQFESYEQFLKHIKSKHDRHQHYVASTIYKFSHVCRDGDTAIICTGYASNQKRDVYVYGIAKIGRYFYDKFSSWWRFKRHAEITIIERNIPISILQKFFGGSSRHTLHGPFLHKTFQAFYRKIGIRHVPISKRRELKDINFLPEEIRNSKGLPEGAVKQVLINAYERNPKARRQCIAHYGAICYICDFDFSVKYGKAGEGYIEVHHLKQLSEIGKRYKIDPVVHLRPVCPNCHAMIHRHDPPYSIRQVKSFYYEAKQNFSRLD